MKDLDNVLIPQESLLNNKLPRPLVEKGNCGGIWQNLEDKWDEDEEQKEVRDCYSSEPTHLQPLSRHSSKVRPGSKKNILKSNSLISLGILTKNTNQI